MAKLITLFWLLALANILSAQTPPPNDLCANAVNLPIATQRGDIDFTSFTTVGATNSGNRVDGVPLFDVWGKFTTGTYIPERLKMEVRLTQNPPDLSVMFYDSCAGNSIGRTGFSTSSANSINRTMLRPNTTYYVLFGLAWWGIPMSPQDTFSVRIYGEEDTIPTPFVFAPIGSGKQFEAKTKNMSGRPLIINNISSTNPSFVPIQRTTQSANVDEMINVSVTYRPTSLSDDTATITVHTTQGNFSTKVNGYPYGNGLRYDSITLSSQNYTLYNLNRIPGFHGFGCFFLDDLYEAHTLPTVINSRYEYRPGVKNLFVLPQITPRPGVNKVSFFATGVTGGGGIGRWRRGYGVDHIDVHISTTDADSSSFVTTIFSDSLTNYGYRYFEIDLSAYNNTPIYVGISTWNSTAIDWYYIVFFDDFRYPDNLSSIEEPNKAQVATLYPNPSSGTLTISLTESTAPDDAKAKVMDLSGRTITEYPFSGSLQKQLDLSHLPSGMYLIEVSTPAAAQTLKWVKVK